jgi:hypothetical protein
MWFESAPQFSHVEEDSRITASSPEIREGLYSIKLRSVKQASFKRGSKIKMKYEGTVIVSKGFSCLRE